MRSGVFLATRRTRAIAESIPHCRRNRLQLLSVSRPIGTIQHGAFACAAQKSSAACSAAASSRSSLEMRGATGGFSVAAFFCLPVAAIGAAAGFLRSTGRDAAADAAALDDFGRTLRLGRGALHTLDAGGGVV
eukprot:3929145-Prymnesium_polylepis.2